MKVAIYIEGSNTQLVLTPETVWEVAAMGGLKTGSYSVHRGSFYDCQGGWTKQGDKDDSVIIKFPT